MTSTFASEPSAWESPAALLAHIVDSHHAYARTELARLVPLARWAARISGEQHPELGQVVAILDAVVEDFIPHMRAEETTLFPAILELVDPNVSDERRRMLRMFIGVARHDHADVEKLFQAMREVTRNYAASDAADPSHRELYQRLAALEANLREHLLLENRLLASLRL